jgi:hypothetical protein
MEEIFSQNTYKLIKVDIEKHLTSAGGVNSARMNNNFPELLLTQFLNLCVKTSKMGKDVTFGRAYIQEQYGIAVAIFEKRLKNKSNKTSHFYVQNQNDLTEILPRDALVEAEQLMKNSSKNRIRAPQLPPQISVD